MKVYLVYDIRDNFAKRTTTKRLQEVYSSNESAKNACKALAHSLCSNYIKRGYNAITTLTKDVYITVRVYDDKDNIISEDYFTVQERVVK